LYLKVITFDQRYGWTLSEGPNPEYTVGKILLIFFNIVIGVFSLGNAGPLAGTLASAKAAGYEVFMIINRVNKTQD
jgi:hypothetical protein